jgi:hypothetical protein
MAKLLKWAKRIGIFLAGLDGFLLALLLMGVGKGYIKKADKAEAKAKEKLGRADLIEKYIQVLKKQNRFTDEEIAAERKRIKAIKDLEVLKDEFTRLGY